MKLYLSSIGEGLGAFITLETVEFYYYSWIEIMYELDVLPID